MKIDLHVHSRHSSDGVMSVDKIIGTARARGLDGIAICDHNAFHAYEEALKLAPQEFIVIPGVEYSTDMGHILALFVTKIYNLNTYDRGLRSIAELRAAADSDGALLVAAHPFRKRSAVPDGLFDTVDGIEVKNSRDMASAPDNARKAAGAAGQFAKFVTGGSDAHIAREIGACFTVLPDDTERSSGGVRAALEQQLSQAGGDGGVLVHQALGKLRRTRPRTFIKDVSRLINFTVKDVTKKWR
ncbi:MAG: PHP domain-containing protein [Oscillospiraceae bacterium]|jgi:predicted metal-dependent phosphoesterase TrpH|nr:PHP domain-containing protein [Oscillospiraceae bacterium]